MELYLGILLILLSCFSAHSDERDRYLLDAKNPRLQYQKWKKMENARKVRSDKTKLKPGVVVDETISKKNPELGGATSYGRMLDENFGNICYFVRDRNGSSISCMKADADYRAPASREHESSE